MRFVVIEHEERLVTRWRFSFGLASAVVTGVSQLAECRIWLALRLTEQSHTQGGEKTVEAG
jgi:hypothetical protein